METKARGWHFGKVKLEGVNQGRVLKDNFPAGRKWSENHLVLRCVRTGGPDLVATWSQREITGIATSLWKRSLRWRGNVILGTSPKADHRS